MKVRDAMKCIKECVGPNDNAAAAIDLMEHHEVPALPVVDHMQPSGTVESDTVPQRAAQIGRQPTQVRVREVMTEHDAWVSPEDELGRARELMEHYRVSWLPVRDEERRIVGVISAEMVARDD